MGNTNIVTNTAVEADKELATNILLIYGKIMLEGQYEVYDARDNLNKLIKFMGLNYVIFITPTNLMLIDQVSNDVKVIVTQDESYNFEKAQETDRAVTAFMKKQVSMEQLYENLRDIERNTASFPIILQMLGAGLVCGVSYILFNHFSISCIYAFFTGCVSYFVYLLCNKYLNIPVFSTFLYSTITAVLAVLFFKYHLIENSYSVVISCMMPVVPGNLFIKSIKNSINEDYMSGLDFFAKAIITTFMLVLPTIFIVSIL